MASNKPKGNDAMEDQPIYENWTLEECENYCRENGITMAELSEKDRRFIHRFLSMSAEDRDLIAQLIDKMSGKGKPSPKCPK